MHPAYKILFFISIIFFLASIAVILVFGLSLGVDFRGGSAMEVRFEQERPALADIKSAVERLSDTGSVNASYLGDDSAVVRLRELNEDEHQAVLSALAELGPITELKFDSIGPVIGSELKQKSITALVLVLAAIIIYIAFVFRRLAGVLSPWVMGLGALAALVHDIFIPVGVFAMLGHYAGITIDAVFIAALLTIIGYSVSDSIVIYDRVRENILRFGKGVSFSDTVHKSVMQTLSRSINTTVSTVLALVAIYFFGGQSLKFLSLALIIGIVAGSYSSIFIASPILVWMNKRSDRNK